MQMMQPAFLKSVDADARTMLATGDLNLSSSDFERKLRDALAGRDPSSLEDRSWEPHR
jgi:hypothetical protein